MIHDNQKIREALTALSSMNIGTDELFLAYEASPSEAVMIGTKDAYLRFAHQCLVWALAENPTTDPASDMEDIPEDLGGYLANTDVKYLFDERGDLWPVCAYVMKTPDQAQLLIERIRTDN